MQKIQTIIDRLLHFEPIQYIFGHTLWNGLDLKVTPATLIPRPETAELVEIIVNNFNRKSIVNRKSFNRQLNVLDIGTGSGCIAISLKKAHPEWHVTGIDISPNAIEVAKENARRNKVDVNFQVADIFSDQMTKYLNKWYMVNDQMVNIVVSNPPYICESEKSSMRPNVLEHEPALALFVPDEDPLVFYRAVARWARTLLRPGGWGYAEINALLGPETAAVFRDAGFSGVSLLQDLGGASRFVRFFI